MKNVSCAAVAAILAGCAGVPQMSVSSAPSTAAASSTMYCAKERLLVDGGRLECNWEPTFEEACRFAKVTTLQRTELAADPQAAGRCESGQWLVKVTRR